MADINVGVNKTNDPSYLGASQGTDRASLQPLASVPDLSTKTITPDYPVNKAAGAAIKGVGDLTEAAIKLSDAVIQRKADDVLTEGINKIRDSFGVGAATTGNGVAEAVGKAGSEGVSLTDPQAAQPVAINRLGNRVEGLTEQYNQGGLSNSAYYAKLEAFVRETKAQFPGYSNEIDSMVATKVGTTPANALRGALLQDVEKLQTKVQSLNDKWTTYENQNAGIIYTIWPNYDKVKDNLSRDQVRAEVAKREAQTYQQQRNDAAIASLDKANQFRGKEAESSLLDFGLKTGQNTVIGFTNTMGIQSAADLRQYVVDVQSGKRKPPTPDEQGQLTGLFSALEQKVLAEIDKKATAPLTPGTTQSYASIIGDPAKIKGVKEASVADIRAIGDGILNEQHGIVAATVQHNKATDALAEKKLNSALPNAVIAGAIRKKIGDNAIGNLIIDAQSGMGADLMVGLRNVGWVNLSNSKSLHSSFETMSQDDPSGVAARQMVKDGKYFIQNKDKLGDPNLADTAFESFYGQGNRLLVDAFNRQPGAQVQLFTDMISPEMTKAAAKRTKADQTKYTNWAEDGFTSVFQTQANGVNTRANSYKLNGNLSLKFNPDTNNFEYSGNRLAPAGMVGAANASLQPLNSAINGMKDVLKLSGKQPTQFLHDKLLVMGIEPGTPLYKALDDEYRKQNAEPGK